MLAYACSVAGCLQPPCCEACQYDQETVLPHQPDWRLIWFAGVWWCAACCACGSYPAQWCLLHPGPALPVPDALRADLRYLPPRCLAVQVFGGRLGVAPVTAAMCALGVLLASGVLSWQDCLEYKPAWDTLIWFTSEEHNFCCC